MEIFSKGLALFQAGGPIMYLILLCSFFVVTIFIERVLYYRSLNKLPEQFSANIRGALKSGEYDTALHFCRDNTNPAVRVAAAGITCLKNAPARLESAMDNESLVVVGKLQRNISHLSNIVTVAPLLGLLGTVIGMIDSFKVMNVKNGEPLAITGGVGEALTATAFGLFVAIFAMAAYSYFTHRQDKIIAQIESITAMIIRTAK